MEGFDGRRVRAALAIPERFAVPVMVPPVPAPATSTTTTTTREVDYVPFVCGHAQWSRPNF